MKPITTTQVFSNVIAVFLMVIFCIATVTKIFDFTAFHENLKQAPGFSNGYKIISYVIIILNLAIVGLLCFSRTRIMALFFSFFLLLSFAIYLGILLTMVKKLPCSCLAMFDNLTWNQNLSVILVMLAITIAALVLNFRTKERKIMIKKKHA